MYARAQPTTKQNVTFIDDLPDLDDLEFGGAMQGGGQFQDGQVPERYKKFIRSSMGEPPSQSGMNPGFQQPQQQFFQPPKQEMNIRPSSNSPTCLEVHDHVQTCPICCRFFKNDNTMYIIAIVILAIVCILLLKRVLDL